MIDPNAMDDDISVIFDRFDSNHDGQISKEEFK